jgi:hypothetical protein
MKEYVIDLGLAILDKFDPIFQFDPIKLLNHLHVNKNCLFQDRSSSEGSRIDDAKDARRTSARTGGSTRTTNARTISSPIKISIQRQLELFHFLSDLLKRSFCNAGIE